MFGPAFLPLREMSVCVPTKVLEEGLPYGMHLLWTASAASIRLSTLRRTLSRESRCSRMIPEDTVEAQWSSEAENVI
jgi:hypothetical protein